MPNVESLSAAHTHLSSASSPTILVLDSGVGGLSVCQSILGLMPAVRVVYLADDAHFPYGLLSSEDLTERLVQLTERMLSEHQPSLVVLACNTVSTLLLPTLRERFDVPFVGVVPAIKPAAELSKTRVIGLLATPATVLRPYTDELIRSFAPDCKVLKLGSRELVVMAENYLLGEDVSLGDLEQSIALLIAEEQLDVVVLGCTHFPLLRSQLEVLLPKAVLIDSGAAIARRVQHLLGSLSENTVSEPSHLIYFTRTIPSQAGFGDHLKALGICQHELRLLA